MSSLMSSSRRSSCAFDCRRFSLFFRYSGIRRWVILVQRVRYMTRAVRMMKEQKRLEKELQQAQKLEAVATLAGGIAHDFNNLLQAIQASSELLLLKTHEGEPSFRILNQIIGAVDRGGGLIRQLLTYSRKIKSDKRPIDLNDQAHQAHQLLQRTIPKMIEIDLRLEEDLKLVDADPVQIEQVLMNLAINARDAMPDGGRLVIMTANLRRPEKHTGTPSRSPSPEWVLLSVSDTGHGMDKGTLEQIFEPFFTTKAPGKGTGLGLSMVHGIVKNHDGRITCRSTPGKGTSFRSISRRSNAASKKSRWKKRRNTRWEMRPSSWWMTKKLFDKPAKYGLKGPATGADGFRRRNGLGCLSAENVKNPSGSGYLIMPGMGGISCLYEFLKPTRASKL